jgi:serine/threonine-protein kinase
MSFEFQEGDLIAGKYRVERLLGVGGMGQVLQAGHIHLGQRVAIKVMLPELARNPEAVARFMREGRAAVRLRSEHVGRVLDVGQLESGAPFLVLEFLDGYDLSDVLAQRGPLPVEEAVDLLLHACEAVAEAHTAGIVHRDLKPANLFLITDAYGSPCVKVLDFGISKVTQNATGQATTGAGLTRTSAVMGSPLYMSPEQMRSSRTVDARSDIWALGVVLYELLTARFAWPGETMSEICVRVATDAAPRVRDVRGDAPEGIDAIIQRCLAKDPADRFQQVADLAEALAPFGTARARITLDRVFHLTGGRRASANRTEPMAGAVAATTAGGPGATVVPSGPALIHGTGVAWGSTGEHKRKGRPLLVIGLVAPLVVAGGVAMVVAKSRSGASGRPSAEPDAAVRVEASVAPRSSAVPPGTAIPVVSAAAPDAGAPNAVLTPPQQPKSRVEPKPQAVPRPVGPAKKPSSPALPEWGGRE